MDPHRLKLAIACIICLSLTVFLTIGFGTLNHVEVQSKAVDYKARFGLFRTCSSVLNSAEKCKSIDYNKIEELNYDPTYYTYYDNSCSTMMALTVAGYACAVLFTLLMFVPFCCPVSAKFLFSVCANFSGAGIVGIISASLYTEFIIDAFENLEDSVSFPHPIDTNRSWSFFIYMAANSLMVIAGCLSCFLTAGFSASQR